ncbi:MAG: hypothetical protein AB1476_03960 [Candidatus Hadarchaeota archaeon]
MKVNVRFVVFDFLFGGALVAGALLVAALLGPTSGGIIAGAPIRTSGVIFLQWLHGGLESAVDLTRGVVLAMVSNVFFAVALYLTLPRYGIGVAFLASGVVFAIAAIALNYLVP